MSMPYKNDIMNKNQKINRKNPNSIKALGIIIDEIRAKIFWNIVDSGQVFFTHNRSHYPLMYYSLI